MLLVAGILNLLSSYFISSVVGNFLVIYVSFFALVVLNIEILSLFSGIYDYNILIFSCLNFIFSFLFFKLKKAKFLKPKIDFSKLKSAFLLDKSLIILGFAFLILISVSGILAYIMPPLEPDSQTYHFLRAFMFSKNHNLSHFDTNDIRALIMPVNSEIIYCWILTLKHKLYNFALLSYASYFAIICAIWQVLSFLKYSVRKKIFAIFVFSSLASVIVEMSCLQTDIVVGALYICALSLFLKKNYFVSSLSIALALGTKTTAFMAMLPFLIFVFVLRKKEFLKYISYLAFNFIIFSSYNYILNFIDYGNIFSNNSAYLEHGFWGGIRGYCANLINFSFQFLDFTGFSWGYYLNEKLFILKKAIFHFINIAPDLGSNFAQKQINITTDEQIVGFGILGFLALIPSVLKGLFSKKKIMFLLALGFILNILILSYSMAYMEYSIRFVLTFAIISSPLFALIYFKKGIYKTLICLFCVFYMAIIPMHIRRAPFYKIFPYLIQNNFNLDKFVKEAYEGKIIQIWTPCIIIKNVILQRYGNAQKIGYFKTTDSSALYLKTNLGVEFLTSSKIEQYDLSEYDLLIFEGEMQDDDVFKKADIRYRLDNNKVIFEKRSLDCFYKDNKQEITDNEKNCAKQWCFARHYLEKSAKFALDYIVNYSDKDMDNIPYYFYVKSEQSVK